MSHQGCSLSYQSFTLSHQSFTLSQQSFTLSHQGFTLSYQSSKISHQGCNISDILARRTLKTISRRPCDGFRRGFDRNDRKSAAVAAAQTRDLFGDFSEGAKARERPSRGRAARARARVSTQEASSSRRRRCVVASENGEFSDARRADTAKSAFFRVFLLKGGTRSERTRGINEDSKRIQR